MYSRVLAGFTALAGVSVGHEQCNKVRATCEDGNESFLSMRTVMPLNEGNFLSGVSTKASIVMFTKTGCPACDYAKPEFAAAAAEAYQANPHVQFVTMHCTDDSKICPQHVAGGYPTIKYITGSTGERGQFIANQADKAQLVNHVKTTLQGHTGLR